MPGSSQEFNGKGSCHCPLFMLWVISLLAVFVPSSARPMIAGTSEGKDHISPVTWGEGVLGGGFVCCLCSSNSNFKSEPRLEIFLEATIGMKK